MSTQDQDPMEVTEQDIDSLHQQLAEEAEASGYHLNPDTGATRQLVKGLIINDRRYGYWSCPCRLAAGEKAKDLDIICPCDYRDQDLNDYGMCYCSLYVTEDILSGRKQVAPIPERRGTEPKPQSPSSAGPLPASLPQPLWHCKVCGYLCLRPNPPQKCPICKADKDRFERF